MRSQELNITGVSRTIVRIVKELKATKADMKAATDRVNRVLLRSQVHDLTAKLAWKLIECDRYEESYALAQTLPWRTHAQDRYLSEGTALVHLNRYVEARDMLKEGARKYPNSAGILVSLGSSYMRLNEFEKSLECTERALLIDPHDHRIQFNKAVDLHNLGFYEDAREILLKILKRRPREQWSHSLLGHCYGQMGYPDDAQKHFLAAISFGYRFVDAYEGLFLAYYNQGMRNDAINTALQGIRKYPGQEPELYMNLAASYHEMGWTTEAIEVLQQAIAAFPENDELKAWLDELENDMNDPGQGEEAEKPKILVILGQKKDGKSIP